jgi:hypothetical protein
MTHKTTIPVKASWRLLELNCWHQKKITLPIRTRPIADPNETPNRNIDLRAESCAPCPLVNIKIGKRQADAGHAHTRLLALATNATFRGSTTAATRDHRGKSTTNETIQRLVNSL